MTTAYWIFLISSAIVVYAWIGYPLIVTVLALLVPCKRASREPANDPSVCIIIPVHDEELKIASKLGDCLELLYPYEALEIIVASDASTDRTDEIVRRFIARDPRVRWLHSARRVGKSGIQNLAAGHARGDLLFFTDANTAMPPGALRALVDHLSEPKVGLVTATVLFGHPEDAVEKGQGFYWRYELFLRAAESDLGILATGSGQALLVRRELFRPLPTCYGDACIMPLDVRLQGYRVLQDQEATVFDALPHSIEGELRTRFRMTARNWTGTLSRLALLNPLRFPFTALGLVSHKLLRWLTPFFLTIILLCNTRLALEGRFITLWFLQIGFYLCACVGWLLTRKQRPAWVFGYAFSFCLANLGFFLGMLKALRNRRIVVY